MMPILPASEVSRNRLIPIAAMAALWTPAMIAASHEWSHGIYYDYGWIVPPVALWLLIRRWNDLDGEVRLPGRWTVMGWILLLITWFTLLRVLGLVDPSWRMPIGLCGLTAALVTHGLIARTRSWRASRGFLWITLFLASALPLPSAVELRLVHAFTHSVVVTASQWFHLAGKPVEVVGDLLLLNGFTVEVAEGCSGVRSFQSFLMATWLFAELQRLSATRTLILLVFAVGAAFLVNVSRAYILAGISFTQGREGFERAHDAVGLVAFLVSAALFYLFSAMLAKRPARHLVKSVQSR
jgi:hypothetical protein